MHPTLQNLHNTKPSVLIVGGGINGVGVFRELAMQGIDTVLIDRMDFAAGASAASSRMIHGGLRYLENGEFALVKESLEERNRLLTHAPHAVKPLPTVIPITSTFSGITNAICKFFRLTEKPAERGALMVKLGLSFYDFLTRRHQSMPRHRFISRPQSLADRPALRPDIVGTARYYDAWIGSPERLCWELIADAEAMSDKVHAFNYVSLERLEGSRVLLKDVLSDQTVSLEPRVVINATGAWIDHANHKVGEATQFIGGTKGSHLLIDNKKLFEATRGEMLFYENKDGRVCILFPIENKVLVGSTDIRIENPDTAMCDDGEVRYMLEAVKQLFPSIDIHESEIVSRYSGVRPLPRSEDSFTGRISRSHLCRELPPEGQRKFPIYSLIGGKWTTFRAFAEEVTDKVLQNLKQQRVASSKETPIGGGKNFPSTEQAREAYLSDLCQQSGFPDSVARILFERYGTTASQVAHEMQTADGATSVDGLPDDYWVGEMRYLLKHERVRRLDDLVLRRTNLALYGHLTESNLETLARLAANTLDWSPQRKEAEVETCIKILRDRHGIQLKNAINVQS